MTALLATLAAILLAYCLFLLKVTREDGERIRLQRAVIDGQRVTLRNQREALRETDAALRLALAVLRHSASQDGSVEVGDWTERQGQVRRLGVVE